MEVSRGEYWEEKRAETRVLSSGFQDKVGEDAQRLGRTLQEERWFHCQGAQKGQFWKRWIRG